MTTELTHQPSGHRSDTTWYDESAGFDPRDVELLDLPGDDDDEDEFDDDEDDDYRD